MVLGGAGEPLRLESRLVPKPRDHELLLEVAACGVCRTDIHVADGDIHGPLPIVPGHEIVGRVIEAGRDAGDFAVGDRVGVPWLGGTCGHCFYCLRGQENLCDAPVFTGFTRDGGFARVEGESVIRCRRTAGHVNCRDLGSRRCTADCILGLVWDH